MHNKYNLYTQIAKKKWAKNPGKYFCTDGIRTRCIAARTKKMRVKSDSRLLRHRGRSVLSARQRR